MILIYLTLCIILTIVITSPEVMVISALATSLHAEQLSGRQGHFFTGTRK